MEELLDLLTTQTHTLTSPRIIEAFQHIDRKHFVPKEYEYEAYQNYPIPIGYGQTISQPQTVAFMLELLSPQEGEKILDVGSGSGWQTAILADIVGPRGKVYAIERIPELKKQGEKNIDTYGFIKNKRVECFAMSAEHGLLEKAPFNKIIAAAELQNIPETWKKQLVVGGKIVAPIKDSICVFTKQNDVEFKEECYEGFIFVPFITES